MCYFNQIRWSCGFWRWRDFRQQCSKEYRTGETCGLKLVYETQIEPDVCKLCHDTEKKQRRYEKMYRDLQRWQREGGRTATIERACGEMHGILGQIYQMREEHSYRSYGGGFGGGMTFQSVSSGVALGGPSVSAMPTMSSLFTMPTFSSSVKVPERLPSPEYGDEVQDHARLRHATPSRSAPTVIPTALRTLPGPPAPPLGSFQDDSVYNGKIPNSTTPLAQILDQDTTKTANTTAGDWSGTYRVAETGTSEKSPSVKPHMGTSNGCLICQRRQIVCNGVKPCSHCIRFKTLCIYPKTSITKAGTLEKPIGNFVTTKSSSEEEYAFRVKSKTTREVVDALVGVRFLGKSKDGDAGVCSTMQSTQSAPVGVGSEASRKPSGARATLDEHGQTDRIGIEEHNHQDNVSGHMSASVTVLSPDSPGHDGHRERGGSEIVEQISNFSISEEDGNVSSTESLSNSFSSDSVLSLGTVATSKKEAIVQYMIKLCRAWFDSRLVILARQCNEGKPGVQSGPTSSVSYTRGSGSTVRGSKRPRASEDEDGLDDERNEDEDNDGRKESGVESESRKLACPFLKYNPGKYQAWRCCRWGWSTVHRVKEHVYRKHRLPKFICSRCCQEFKTSTQLLNHQRADEPCKLKTELPMDGINEEQFQALRSRKRPREAISEEEKWVKMYKVIFPDEDVVPFPWQLNEKDHDAKSLVRDLGDHARRELPRLMRPRLEDMLDRVIEESLTSDRIVELAQGVFQDILQTFRHIQADLNLLVGDDAGNPMTLPVLESSSSVDEFDGANRNAETINESDGAFATFALGQYRDPSFQIDQSSLDTVFQDAVVDSFGDHSFDLEDFLASTGAGGNSDSGYGSLGQSMELEKK